MPWTGADPGPGQQGPWPGSWPKFLLTIYKKKNLARGVAQLWLRMPASCTPSERNRTTTFGRTRSLPCICAATPCSFAGCSRGPASCARCSRSPALRFPLFRFRSSPPAPFRSRPPARLHAVLALFCSPRPRGVADPARRRRAPCSGLWRPAVRPPSTRRCPPASAARGLESAAPFFSVS